jgi:hypothetical protein
VVIAADAVRSDAHCECAAAVMMAVAATDAAAAAGCLHCELGATQAAAEISAGAQPVYAERFAQGTITKAREHVLLCYNFATRM